MPTATIACSPRLTEPVDPMPRAGPGLWLQVEHPHSNAAVVHVAGELDTITTPSLAELLFDRLATATGVVVLDLSAVTFAGVAALHLLVRARERAQLRGIAFRLVTGTRAVDRALHTAGMTGMFAIHAGLSSAVAG